MPEEHQVFSIQEVADKLRVSDDTVRRMISRGDLPAFRMGWKWRIKKEVLERLMQEKK